MAPPSWLDREHYPFAPHFFPTDAGRMHYVDEGDGPPVVMLHGNPTWSFLYRHLIWHLSPSHRCVAPDFIGFGRSDKPADWSYRPQAHAVHLEALLTQLDLRDITLVVHDWGGPIGLSYALRHPNRVRRLVITNTWMWPLDSDPWVALFSRLMGGPVGRLLIERYNAFARFVLPMAFHQGWMLSDRARRHYLQPLTGVPRRSNWMFPRALLSETDWLRNLWARRERLGGIPALLVWGMHDPAFRPKYLRRWKTLLPHATVHERPVGHYVAEEDGLRFPPLVGRFLEDTA